MGAHRLGRLAFAQGLDLPHERVDDGMGAQLSWVADLADLAMFLQVKSQPSENLAPQSIGTKIYLSFFFVLSPHLVKVGV